MQRSLVGSDGAFRDVAAELAKGPATRAGTVCHAAREAGVPVVHGILAPEPDFTGWNANAPVFAVAARRLGRVDRPVRGREALDLLEELGYKPGDVIVSRRQGIGPMSTDDLEIVLRHMGVARIVVVGVSLNLALTNLVFDAVNRGFHVVVVRDAVAGVPTDYAEAVIDRTLSLVAELADTADVVALLQEMAAERIAPAPDLRL